jgi:hypothetical protein
MAGWRITTINGLFLAAYFMPVWAISAFRIVIHPMLGIYERANIAPVTYVSDAFQFTTLGIVRFAWLLVVAKFVVVAFLGLFTVLTWRGRGSNRADGDEALVLALMLGGIVSVGSMLAASSVGEGEALRLHATEALMLLGGFVVFAIDSQSYGVQPRDEAVAESTLVPKAAGVPVARLSVAISGG